MRTYFAAALLGSVKAVQSGGLSHNGRYHRSTSIYEPQAPYVAVEEVYYEPEPAKPAVVVKEPYHREPIYYAPPVFDYNFERIFDASQEVYFGTDSESDIDNDSKSGYYSHDESYSSSGSSLGLSGPGYTFYSGSDSGTESSSHHSQSTVRSYDYFYDKEGNWRNRYSDPYFYNNRDHLYNDERIDGTGVVGYGPRGAYGGRFDYNGGYGGSGSGLRGAYGGHYDDYYYEEEPYYRDIIYTDSCSSCSESFPSVSTYYDPEFFYVNYETETYTSDSEEDSTHSTYYNKEPVCARAYMTDAHASLVYGHFDFKQESIYDADHKKGVKIIGELEGVWPRGNHGLSINEYGDLSHHCENTGGHWNPYNSKVHGSPDNTLDKKYAGDLGNIRADRDGRAYYWR